MANLKFRNAAQHDLTRIVELYNSTILSRMVTADTEPVSVASWQQWFEEHIPNKRPLWMVEDSFNQLVGWVSFQSFYGRPAYDATVELSIYLDERHASSYTSMLKPLSKSDRKERRSFWI